MLTPTIQSHSGKRSQSAESAIAPRHSLEILPGFQIGNQKELKDRDYPPAI